MSVLRFPPLSRRGFVVLLTQGAAAWGGRALANDPSAGVDRGIGGTGAAPIEPDETLGQDRGIGGTGVIGTIRRFGSIVVNDLRVAFPPGVSVTIDGRAATAGDLRVGHVVRVLARRRGDTFATRAIVAESEVVGPLDAATEDHIEVLGQRVVVPVGVAVPKRGASHHVAVSGLRRLDGTVVASLVERRPEGAARLRGPVEKGLDGRPAVGDLPIQGLSPTLIGSRVALVGRRRNDAFHPTTVTVEPEVPFAGAERLSIEAYVARATDGLRLGSGLDVSAGPSVLAELGDGAPSRAVVVAYPDGTGRLDARFLRVEHEPRGSGHDQGRRSDSGPPGEGSGPGVGGPRGGSPDGAPSGDPRSSNASGAPGGNGVGKGGPGGPGR